MTQPIRYNPGQIIPSKFIQRFRYGTSTLSRILTTFNTSQHLLQALATLLQTMSILHHHPTAWRHQDSWEFNGLIKTNTRTSTSIPRLCKESTLIRIQSTFFHIPLKHRVSPSSMIIQKETLLKKEGSNLAKYKLLNSLSHSTIHQGTHYALFLILIGRRPRVTLFEMLLKKDLIEPLTANASWRSPKRKMSIQWKNHIKSITLCFIIMECFRMWGIYKTMLIRFKAASSVLAPNSL